MIPPNFTIALARAADDVKTAWAAYRAAHATEARLIFAERLLSAAKPDTIGFLVIDWADELDNGIDGHTPFDVAAGDLIDTDGDLDDFAFASDGFSVYGFDDIAPLTSKHPEYGLMFDMAKVRAWAHTCPAVTITA